MKKKTSRTLQAERTKSHILDEALKLMKYKNFDDISIQEICESSGVSTGAFYHHFGSKSGIVVAAYTRTDQFFQEEVINKIDSSNIKNAIIGYLCEQGLYAKNMGVDIIRNIYKAQMDNASAFFLSAERGLPKGLHQLVEKGLDNGELSSDKTADQITEELLIISRGILYNWAICFGEYDISKKTSNIIKAYLQSI